jgi:hypothetical protein
MAAEQLTTHTAWLDSRLCGCQAHGGPEARRIALEARRQAALRRMLNPTDDHRQRVIELDAFSAAVLADRDLPDLDYAGGAGY